MKRLVPGRVLYCGHPPVAAATLVTDGKWDVEAMKHVEEKDPDPFLELLDTMGLSTIIKEM